MKNSDDFLILSLTTTYPESKNPKMAQFVHLINKEFVKMSNKVITIVPHVTNSKSEILDSVIVKRFRYLPNKYEKIQGGIADSVHRSKFEIIKILFMVVNFLFFSIVQCKKESPDVIHAHWAFPAGFIGSILSSIFRKKLFVTIYTAEFALLNEKFKFLKPLVKSTLNKSHKVIAISNYAKNEAIKLGVNENKITIIEPAANFVKFNYSEKEKNEYRNKIVDSSKKIILFVGRLVERKGVGYLIDSLNFLPKEKIHLVIAGGGPLLGILKEHMKKMKLENNITFIEKPSDHELGLLYHVSDIFVLPSIVDAKGDTEGLGLVMLEAMDCKKPVIASNVGGILDVVQDGKNGLLVNQKDSESLANAIKKLLLDKNLVEQLVKESQITVKNFLPSTISMKYLQVFKSNRV